MARILVDLLWWLGHRAWRAARMLSGDDAYERYLGQFVSARPEDPPMSPARFYELRTAQKWDRIAACGRCSDFNR